MVSRMDEFREFVSKHPGIKEEVKQNNTTWHDNFPPYYNLLQIIKFGYKLFVFFILYIEKQNFFHDVKVSHKYLL